MRGWEFGRAWSKQDLGWDSGGLDGAGGLRKDPTLLWGAVLGSWGVFRDCLGSELANRGGKVSWKCRAGAWRLGDLCVKRNAAETFSSKEQWEHSGGSWWLF